MATNSLLLMVHVCLNFVCFNTEISAPESTRNVDSELKSWEFKLIKLDNAVFMLNNCSIVVLVARWLWPIALDVGQFVVPVEVVGSPAVLLAVAAGFQGLKNT